MKILDGVNESYRAACDLRARYVAAIAEYQDDMAECLAGQIRFGIMNDPENPHCFLLCVALSHAAFRPLFEQLATHCEPDKPIDEICFSMEQTFCPSNFLYWPGGKRGGYCCLRY